MPLTFAARLLGLSPRVRGNHQRIHACASSDPRVCGGPDRIVGSIPACAGEPRPDTLHLSPRVRGNLCLAPCRPPSRRSIPACAGEPALLNGRQDYLARSIPACAGEPSAGSSMIPETRSSVYPRVCGGTLVLRPECGIIGLSPRVRGNRPLVRPGLCFSRAMGLSPRVRGNPSVDSVAVRIISTPSGLSPRVRGNLVFVESCLGLTGLSPRVRGNPGPAR